tara:strand:- start:75 stop:1286 length:1212 start_codon:yes stop_codon:yes gene_type:complete
MNKIKIGIDSFENEKPTDNCVDFRIDKHDGWNEFPCQTGFVIQWFFNNLNLYEYVDTKVEDNFIYPINFKCFINGLGISVTEVWEKDISEWKPKRTFLDSIPDYILEKVRNNKAKILLNYGFEEYDIKQRDTILYFNDFLVDRLNEKNIPIDNVYYTDSNYSLDYTNLDIESFSQNYTANCFYIDTGEVGSNIDHFRLSDNQIEKKKKTELTKKYICYNRLKKWHRERVVNWIKENEYLEDGYVSFPPDLTLDYTNFNDNWAYHKICTYHYDTSFFSIVNESHYGTYKSGCLTEKTWKAIFNFHPIIIVGAKGSLRYLKEQGFDIFEDIFDSSYDDIYDKTERLEKIFDVVDNFLKNNNLSQLEKIREDIFPRLLHNYNHFWGDFREYVVNDFNIKLRNMGWD